MSAPEGPSDVFMADPGPGPGPGPSLVDSPSSSSSESHVSYDISMLPPDDQCMDYTPVFPGEWQQEDATSLQEKGWSRTTLASLVSFQAYVPFWTKPNWDPTIETTIEGMMQRAVRGGAEAFMRPTIISRDRDVPRTDYTKYVCYHAPKGWC